MAEVRLGRFGQVQVRRPVRLHHADIPARGIHAMNLGSRLVSARLGRVTSAVGSAAEGQELAVGRPVYVVDLIRLLVLNAHGPLADRGRSALEIDGRRRQFVVARSPGHLLAVRAEAGPAAGNLQVDDLVPMRLDEQNRMVKAHAGMHGRHDPFAARQPSSGCKGDAGWCC